MTALPDDRQEPRQWLATAEATAYEGEPLTEEDLDVLDVEAPELALELYQRAVRQQVAAAKVVKVLGNTLARTLGEGGAARYGNTVVRYRKGGKEAVVDDQGFWAELERRIKENEIRMRDLFNPNAVKRTPLPQAIRDTFFKWTTDEEPSLQSVPLDKAPKYLQALDEGAVHLGKREEDG